jgi:hypothetical protein
MKTLRLIADIMTILVLGAVVTLWFLAVTFHVFEGTG